MDFPWLSLIVFLPAAGAIAVAFYPGLQPRSIKLTAAAFTLVTFGLSLAVFAMFDRSSGADLFQFEERVTDWIPIIHADYHLGVDGLSLPFLVLTTFLGFLAVLVSWKVTSRPREARNSGTKKAITLSVLELSPKAPAAIAPKASKGEVFQEVTWLNLE